MKKVFATLRALEDVMEAVSKDADPHGAGRHIMEEVPVSYLLFCMDH
jgi:callose synthase